MARAARMKRELHMLETEPPAGVSAWPRDESNVFLLDAEVRGADETPYSGGHFKLEVTVPERYPFEPPKVRFMTSIYHPNVDTSGRICLDILNMPPKGELFRRAMSCGPTHVFGPCVKSHDMPAGGWKPSLNISNVLLSIQLLMSEPNPADPLMADIAQEYFLSGLAHPILLASVCVTVAASALASGYSHFLMHRYSSNRPLFLQKARECTATNASLRATPHDTVGNPRTFAMQCTNPIRPNTLHCTTQCFCLFFPCQLRLVSKLDIVAA